jgi:hypothetical protein
MSKHQGYSVCYNSSEGVPIAVQRRERNAEHLELETVVRCVSRHSKVDRCVTTRANAVCRRDVGPQVRAELI